MTTSSEHSPGTWEIDWYVCRMDQEDVRYAMANGNKNAKVGDELWRVPRSIGPVSVDHNHWAGSHISCSPEDARLLAAAPDLLEALRRIVDWDEAGFALTDDHVAQAKAAIAKATGGAA